MITADELAVQAGHHPKEFADLMARGMETYQLSLRSGILAEWEFRLKMSHLTRRAEDFIRFHLRDASGKPLDEEDRQAARAWILAGIRRMMKDMLEAQTAVLADRC